MWLYLIGIALVIIDQVTKYIAVENLRGKPSVVIIDGILSFTYVENKGAAFGIFSNSRFFLLVITVILIVVILYAFFNSKEIFESKFSKPLLMLILSGAIGNMIDRFFLGYVVDFIHATFINFPVFNVADMCVVCGSVLLMVVSLKD